MHGRQTLHKYAEHFMQESDDIQSEERPLASGKNALPSTDKSVDKSD